MQIISEFQTLLKNTTLNEFSYQKALKILNKMEDPDLRIPLQEHLKSAFEKAQNSSGFLLLFSDITMVRTDLHIDSTVVSKLFVLRSIFYEDRVQT